MTKRASVLNSRGKNYKEAVKSIIFLKFEQQEQTEQKVGKKSESTEEDEKEKKRLTNRQKIKVKNLEMVEKMMEKLQEMFSVRQSEIKKMKLL